MAARRKVAVVGQVFQGRPERELSILLHDQQHNAATHARLLRFLGRQWMVQSRLWIGVMRAGWGGWARLVRDVVSSLTRVGEREWAPERKLSTLIRTRVGEEAIGYRYLEMGWMNMSSTRSCG